MAGEDKRTVEDIENLDDSVILEDEQDLVMDHNYDGIKELDHPLPSWWLATFWGGIIFGFFYAMYYLVADGPTLRETYRQDMARIREIRQASKQDVTNFESQVYATYTNGEKLSKGKEVFQMNCVACHAQKGKGDIGPNLTDNHWILAKGTPESIYEIVVNGNEDQGMPAWKEILTKKEMYAVTAYVRSLHGANVKDEKEPQGEYIDPKKYDQK